MKKVMQFKTTLSSIDVVVNIFTALAVISGIIVATSQPIIGVSLIIGSGCFWLVKICGFGISYTLIQIAENTFPENINTSSSINMTEVIHKNKASEFIQIYVKNQNEYGKNPTLKKVFDNLVEDIMLESTSNIEYSIRLMLTKTDSENTSTANT